MIRMTWLLVAAALFCGCRKSGPPGSFASSGYHVRDDAVWYLSGWPSTPQKVEKADRTTFEHPISGDSSKSYARDKSHVFFRGAVIPNADPLSFRIVDEDYSRDAKHVFRGTALVCDDPDHFESLGLYVKNSHAVYRVNDLSKPMEARIVSTDAAHFRNLAPESGIVFYGDRKQLFVGFDLIPDVNPAEFHFLGSGYWSDSKEVFYRESPMPEGIDAATFKALDGGYARDSKRAYYLGKELPGSDGASFEITDPNWPKAKDQRQRYDQGQVLPLE